MRLAYTFLVCTLLTACTSLSCDDCAGVSALADTACVGVPAPPASLQGSFEPAQSKSLLAESLGEPGKGGMCEAAVFTVTSAVTVFRSWNSTNPGSEFGKWWTFFEPKGPIANYRSDYEICYEFSPLDKMSRCVLEPGTKVVIGTGQSVVCSQYLSYGVSAGKQLYIPEAESSVSACAVFDGEFNWVPAQ